MKNPNLNKDGSYYGAWKNEFNDYVIDCHGVLCYLLIGKDKALLIDTGYGYGDLAYFVETLTNLPLIVVNTHGHGDHSGGDAFFNEVWIGEDGIRTASNTKTMKHGLPFSKNVIWKHLQEGLKFDIGDRIIEAISIPAHHVSSYAFLDYKTRSLFSGDEIDPGQVLLFCSDSEESCMERAKKHLHNMKKLKSRINEFDRIYPAHNGDCISTDYIDDFIELATDYINRNIQPEDNVAGNGWPNFIFGGNKSLLRIKKGLANFIIRREDL